MTKTRGSSAEVVTVNCPRDDRCSNYKFIMTSGAESKNTVIKNVQNAVHPFL